MTPHMQDLGKAFTLLGLVFLILGLMFNLVGGLPKLPGDIYIDRGGFKVYIPWVSSLVISVILTLLLNLFRK